jgi:hypothetical protein
VLVYAPPQGASFRYRTDNTLTVTQSVLGRRNHYTLSSTSVVRLTLLNPGPRLLWRLGFDELGLRVTGAFPTPRVERLRGTVVTLATTPGGLVLDAITSGIGSPGIGGQYVERAAESFLPRLPEGPARPGATWSDTLTVTEVLRGVTARVTTVLTYSVADTSAIAARPVVPVTYEGRITVTGAGTIQGSRVSLSGSGTVDGHYLYDPTDRVFDLHVQEQVLDSMLTIGGPSRVAVEIPSRQVLRARAERLF